MVAETVARNVLSQVLSDGKAAGVLSQVELNRNLKFSSK